jgi:deoxyribodipyrimidine photo-lyase
MTASEEIGLVWFRRDLRLDDNPAWAAATSECKYIVPLYVIDPPLLDSVGPFRRRQLIANLQALDYELAEGSGEGGRLLVRFGDPRQLVPQAVDVLGAGQLYFNADVSPFALKRDQAVTKQLSVPVHTSFGGLVLPPGSVLTKKGTVSRVFTSFYKVWQRTPWDPWPEPAAPGQVTVYDDPGEFVPQLDAPPPMFEGPREAHRRLEAFLAQVDRYDTDRDRPDRDASSRLSADLRFGTLSARTVAEAVGDSTEARKAFLRQLVWRDWFSHLLHENPNLPTRAMRERFDRIKWLNDPGDIARWKGGFTGYPIVDAGMRELLQTGFMHNRVRMIVGSFLVKDLLVDWRIGEAHFRHLLTDFDVASNVGNWQWVAGTGPDAQPFFRVFNPVSQSRQYDPDGVYIRRWVPELEALDNASIHAPWEVSAAELEKAGLEVGRDYPEPIVNHAEARERALIAYKAADAPPEPPPDEPSGGATAEPA